MLAPKNACIQIASERPRKRHVLQAKRNTHRWTTTAQKNRYTEPEPEPEPKLPVGLPCLGNQIIPSIRLEAKHTHYWIDIWSNQYQAIHRLGGSRRDEMLDTLTAYGPHFLERQLRTSKRALPLILHCVPAQTQEAKQDEAIWKLMISTFLWYQSWSLIWLVLSMTVLV